MNNYNISFSKGNKHILSNKEKDKVYFADLYKITSLKIDLMSISEPIFSIGKKRSFKVSSHKLSNKMKLDIIPSVEHGGFLSSDKTTLIYILSKIHAIYKKENVIPKKLSFTLNDFFLETGCTKEEIKNKSGKNRDSVRESFERLAATKLRFITYSGKNKKEKTVEREMLSFVNEMLSEEKEWRYVKLSIDIPDWIQDKFRGIKYDLLTLDQRYWSIEDSCLKRLYEIARRFCGHKEYFEIKYKKLLQKIGIGNSNVARTKKRIIDQVSGLEELGYMLSIIDDVVTIINTKISQEKKERIVLEENKTRSLNTDVSAVQFDRKNRKIISVAELVDLTPIGMTFAKFLSMNKHQLSVQGQNIYEDPSLFIESGYGSIFSTKIETPPLFKKEESARKDEAKKKENSINEIKKTDNDVEIYEHELTAALVDEKTWVEDGIYKKHLTENELLLKLIKRFKKTMQNEKDVKVYCKFKNNKLIPLMDDKFFKSIYKFYIGK